MDLFARLIRRYGKRDAKFYAKRMGVEATDFNGAVSAMSGLPSREWINRYLMLAACEMLEKSDMKITKIYKRLGFTAASVFTTFFKEYTKLTPYSWRCLKRDKIRRSYQLG